WPGLRLDVPADCGLVAVAAAVAAPAGASAGAVFTRLGLVDGQRAALVVGPVEGGDRLVAALAHLYEGEAPRAAGVAVADDLGPGHAAVLAEDLQEVIGGGLEGEVSDVNVLAHHASFAGSQASR